MAEPSEACPRVNRPEARARFDALVVPEIEVLFRVARSITGDPDDAEDLVQESLLRAFRSMDTFDGQHIRAWLLTIMRNANISSHRRQRPVLLRDGDGGDDRSTRKRESSPSAEEVASAHWIEEELDEALEQLATRQREALQLVDINGLTYEEAAAVLDVPVGTVMSRLHRGRRKVRNRLESHSELVRKTP